MTTFLAIWGAVVSTIAIIWNICRDVSDRAKLRIICYIGQIVGEGSIATERKLVYHVANIGRRPVIVTHIGGAFGRDEHFLAPNAHRPQTLQPYGCYLLECTDLSVLHQKPIALWAIDSLGKHWKISRKELQELIRKNEESR